jgi:dihydropteroate synthase
MSLSSSARATSWKLRTRRLVFGSLPAVMGIVNVTPDSFSDGGSYLATTSAVDHALRLEDAGADILDIGGESTRPYSAAVAAEDELRRVVPVLEALRNRVAVPISIDTSKASVAQAAIDLGAEIINDVTGLEGDVNMGTLAATTQVGVCAMHMQGNPQTMQDNPSYADVVTEIKCYLGQRDQALRAIGISPDQICLDPGIGFGKSTQHNLQLLRAAEQFLALGRPILIGHSRKGFIGKIAGSQQSNRDAGTLGISLAMAAKGIQLIRVHDVASTIAALKAYHACLSH